MSSPSSRFFTLCYDDLGLIRLFLISRPPPIDVSTNDTLILHTLNSLDEPATIHHHGMFFNSTSWFDGAMGVTQWYVLAYNLHSGFPSRFSGNVTPKFSAALLSCPGCREVNHASLNAETCRSVLSRLWS